MAANRQTDSDAASNHARRFLRFDDRRRSFSGCLPEDHYARVKGALTARAGRRPTNSATFEQRMADVLVEVCGLGEAGSVPSKRTTVVVHADLTYLADVAAGVARDEAGAGADAGGGADAAQPGPMQVLLGPTEAQPGPFPSRGPAEPNSTCSDRSPLRSSADLPVTPESSCQRTTRRGIPSNREQRVATRARPSDWRSGGGTKVADFPVARIPSSPTSTTSCTGSTAGQLRYPTSSPCATSTIVPSTNLAGRCQATRISRSRSAVQPDA